MKQLLLTLGLLLPPLTFAQTYSVDWYKISGGGGTSTNAQYSIDGTVGQPDASDAMTNSQYSLIGGYWAIIQVVQTPGLPRLTLTRNATAFSISWPATNSVTLQQNWSITNHAGWTASGLTINTASNMSSVTFTQVTGPLFFRLTTP